MKIILDLIAKIVNADPIDVVVWSLIAMGFCTIFMFCMKIFTLAVGG